MNAFAWNEILGIWKDKTFQGLIYEKTIYGILQSLDKKGSWDKYLNWVKTEFNNTAIEIDKVITDDVQQQIAHHIDNREYPELIEYLNTKFIKNLTILTVMKKELREKINSFSQNSYPDLGITFFKDNTKDLLTNLSDKINETTHYNNVEELIFLKVVILNIFYYEMANTFETLIDDNEFEWKEVETNAITAIQSFFTTFVDLIDDPTISLDNGRQIDIIKTSLIEQSLKLADVIEQGKITKLENFIEGLWQYFKSVYHDTDLIYADEKLPITPKSEIPKPSPQPPKADPLENFYTKYKITTQTDKDAWSAYKTEADAEAVYTNAINAITSITNSEKTRITDAKTPTAIKNVKDEILLERKKADELKKYEALLVEINDATKTTLKSLPANFKKTEIEALNNSLLPTGKKKETLTARLLERRAAFTLSLKNKDDTEGIDEDAYNKIQEKRKNKYQTSFEEKLTSKILNELLKDSRVYLQIKPSDKKDRDLTDFLTGKENIGTPENPNFIKGYKIEDEPALDIKVEGNIENWKGADIEKQENEWKVKGLSEKQGKLKLPFFYKKNNFDPDNLIADSFVKFKLIGGKGGKKSIDLENGALAIATGIGKTTKTVSCLCEGGKRNIVLITPTEGLALSAFGHHSGWLQKNKHGIRYTCVYHGNQHGEYKVAINSLTRWKDDKGNEYGEKGVSVLWYPYLLGYLARELLEVRKITIGERERDVERIKKQLEIAKGQMIPDDTIFIFDEAHYSKSAYQQTILGTVFMEDKSDYTKPAKKVLLMSATFKNKPFSITTSYPLERREVVPFRTTTIFNDSRYKNFDEKLANSQTLLFLPSHQLNNEQKKIIEKLPYVIFNETNQEASEGISEGVPNGGLMIIDSTGRMGYNFKCQTVIDCAVEEEANIKGGWVKDIERKSYSVANLTQGSGRGGRFEKGSYHTLSSKTEDPANKVNLLGYMVKALFGEPDGLKRTFFSNYDNAKLVPVIQAAFAFDERWGREPEALLIGLIANITGINCFPRWETTKKPTWDNDLWLKHTGNYIPPKTDPKQAEAILLLMINTYLSREADISKDIKIGFSNQLIKDAEWKLEDEDSIDKIRSVLNKVVEDKLKLISTYEESKIIYKASEEEDYNKVVNLLKAIKDTKIKIMENKDENGNIRKDWGIKIDYEKK